MQAAVTRYRVMAYVTGVLLIVLFFVAIPLKVFADQGVVSTAVGIPHGMVCYPLYLIASFDLYRRARWPLGRMVIVVLAGLVPFLAFVVERKIVADLRPTPSASRPGQTAVPDQAGNTTGG